MPSSTKISALVITYNEIGYIERCIESILFADEIIVVDSFSTDGTYDYLVRHPKVRTMQRPFDNFTAQKSFALEQAANDWILFVDADEVVPDTLRDEIIAKVSSPSEIVAYWFYRKFMFQNERLKYSGWQTDKNYRLFRKSKAKFSEDKIVHETLTLDGPSGILKEKLLHFCFKNFDDYRSKMLSYGRLRALEEKEKGKKWSILPQILRPLWKFTNHYLIRLGFLDGKKGFTISYLNALGVAERYRELKRLHKPFSSAQTTYKFLIYISYSYAYPIGRPLYEQIRTQGYQVKWFIEGTEAKKNNPFLSDTLNSVKEIMDYEPHIILTASNQVPDFFPGLKVQVFHGFNAEKRNFRKGHFRIRGFFDLYCTHGPSTTVVFEEEREKNAHFEVIETGWGKMDPLFPLVKNTDLNGDTVLISSTFTEKLSLAYNNDVFLEIARLSKDGKFKFLNVLHPKLPDNVKDKWKSLEGDNFKYFDTTDLIPLFQQADIMFSDTSSTIQEFLLQGKPVVTFRHNVPKPLLINVETVPEIEKALILAMTYPTEQLDLIHDYVNKIHPYRDGQSSRRTIKASIDFLHKNKAHIKSKPLNLARKLKIRIKLRYFTLKSYARPITISKSDIISD